MANGQQKSQQNLDAFELWKTTQSTDDFKQIIYRGQLSRNEIAKAIGCGKSALNQNPNLRESLKSLEDDLRAKGVLPQLVDAEESDAVTPKKYDNTKAKRTLESKRLSELEVENIALKAENRELKARLERFCELSDTLTELGFMPQ